MLKAVVVEDEYKVRQVLVFLLKKYCPQVEVVAEAEDLDPACSLVQQHQPDVVFLDIEMPGGSGFELLERFGPRLPFTVIFVTSFGHYSISAIRAGAFDYLLKPVIVEELQQAVCRLEEKLRDREPAAEEKRLVLNHKNKIESVPVNEILYLQADGNYTIIHTVEGRKYHIARTLKEHEKMLCAAHPHFSRVHKTYIVNLQFVKHLKRGPRYALILHDGSVVDVARHRRQELLQQLGYG